MGHLADPRDFLIRIRRNRAGIDTALSLAARMVIERFIPILITAASLGSGLRPRADNQGRLQ